MDLDVQVSDGKILIQGDTYRYRDILRALGGRFDGASRGWQLPLSDFTMHEVSRLVERRVGGEGGPAALPRATELGACKPGGAAIPLDRGGDLSVGDIVSRVAQGVSALFPQEVWVVGEIQNLAVRARGVYFQLAESKERSHRQASLSLSAVLWQNSAAALQARLGDEALGALLQDGLSVRCLCKVALYRDRGQISLSVVDMDPSFTRGALALARERTLRRMRELGIAEAQRHLRMTPFPFCVGLVTAEGSRALGDFLDQLALGGFPGEVVLCAAAMQGDSAPREVAAAIRFLSDRGVDCIVVTRGGGSASDLRWFDSEEVAEAVCRCTVPIVAAIGHQDDICVAEEVAFQRQKTPTAAAEAILSFFTATCDRMRTAAQRLVLGADVHLRRMSQGLEALRTALERASGDRLKGEELRLVRLERDWAQLDPRPWLRQGWTQLRRSDGLGRVQSWDVPAGLAVEAVVLDGWIDLVVTGSRPRVSK